MLTVETKAPQGRHRDIAVQVAVTADIGLPWTGGYHVTSRVI